MRCRYWLILIATALFFIGVSSAEAACPYQWGPECWDGDVWYCADDGFSDWQVTSCGGNGCSNGVCSAGTSCPAAACQNSYKLYNPGCTAPSDCYQANDGTSLGCYYSAYQYCSSGCSSGACNLNTCAGTASLSLTPGTVLPGGTFTASVFNLSGCSNRLVSFYRDVGGQWQSQGTCTISGTGNGCLTNLTAPLTEGTYWYSGGTDKDGDGLLHQEKGELATALLTVGIPDTTPPTGTLNVNAVSVTLGQSVTVTITGNDNKNVANVQLHHGGSWDLKNCAGVQNSCAQSWTISEPAVGNYTYTGYVVDAAGNGSYTSPMFVNVSVSNVDAPPQIEIFTNSPANAFTVGQSINITVKGTDDKGLSWFYLDGPGISYSGGTCNWAVCYENWSSYCSNKTDCSVTWPLVLNQGTHTYNAWVFDAISQKALAALTLTVNPPPDTTKPTIGLIAPTATMINTPTNFSAAVADTGSGLDQCWLYAANSPGGVAVNQGLMTISGGVASRNHTFSLAGNYDTFAYCTDKAGNFNYGASVAVLATLPPVCPAPATFEATEKATNSITMKWAAVSGAIKYKMVWAKTLGLVASPADWPDLDPLVDYGEIITSDTKATAMGLKPGTRYGFDVKVEEGDNVVCKASESLAQEIAEKGWWKADFFKFFKGYWYSSKLGYFPPQIRTLGCFKTTTPQAMEILPPVTLANGQTCTIKIEPLGQDIDPNDKDPGVSYETLDSGAGWQQIGMDDNPATGCDDDIVFTNSWTKGTGFLSVTSVFNRTWAYHDLAYGYKLTAGQNCAFSTTDFTRESCKGMVGLGITGSRNDCDLPDVNPKTVTIKELWENKSFTKFISETKYQYQVIPDNAPTITSTPDSSWHKNTPLVNANFTDDISLGTGLYYIDPLDPTRDLSLEDLKAVTWTPIPSFSGGGKTYSPNFSLPVSAWNTFREGDNNKIYFKAIDEAGNEEINLQPLTIKKDTVAPGSDTKIIQTSINKDVTGDWANTDIELQLEDNDPLPGSGLGIGSCKYDVDLCDKDGGNCVNEISANRLCNQPIGFPAGKDAPVFNTEGDKRTYRISSQAIDGAGNSSVPQPRYIRFDFTPPTAQ